MRNNKFHRGKIAVAMSGGVDSSVAAHLLKTEGYETTGVFMRLSAEKKHQIAEEAARRVCYHLKVKFYPLNLSDIFQEKVVKYFLDGYAGGFTPNPCVRCNQLIKFGELAKRVRELNIEKLATGHYVQCKIKNEKCKIKEFRLIKSVDEKKDQSYFLWHLTQEKLAKIIFPLGGYLKSDVRKIANDAGLPYLKAESQDICFLTGDHNDFLRANIELKPGDIQTFDHKIIGRHQGLPLYTVGQRKGIEIGGRGPYYAADFDYAKNILYVTNDPDDQSLYQSSLTAESINWISGNEPDYPYICQAVIRYRHKAVECKISKSENVDKPGCLVEFEKSQRAVAPGQSIVFYNGDELLGGGIIAR